MDPLRTKGRLSLTLYTLYKSYRSSRLATSWVMVESYFAFRCEASTERKSFASSRCRRLKFQVSCAVVSPEKYEGSSVRLAPAENVVVASGR